MDGRLTLIPTPIGNLEDITLRAVRLLRSCDLLLCEDTRTTGKLLGLLDLPKRPLLSLNARNESGRIDQVLQRLEAGDHLGLLSDAGTPGISDPGLSLVGRVIEAGFEVDVLPGPTALIPSLILSGLPARPFQFEGFLPHKKGRQTRLMQIARLEITFLLYESPHRLLKVLNELREHCGEDRPCAVVRELTKMHQETVRGTVGEVAAEFERRSSIKGECVVVVGGALGA